MISGSWYPGFDNLVCDLTAVQTLGYLSCIFTWDITNQFGGDTKTSCPVLWGAHSNLWVITPVRGVVWALLDINSVNDFLDR